MGADCPAAANRLVVAMRADDQDPAHFRDTLTMAG
jgi:hypothetical protein